METLFSILVGTAGLTVAAVAALALTVSRPAPAADAIRSVRTAAVVALALQAGHFVEELVTGMYVALPETLGLSAWPVSFFVAFNAAWIVLWLAAIAAPARLGRIGVFALWFLGIGSAANGVVHPLLAVLSGDYFPGLWTSPLGGAAGLYLLHALTAATRRDARQR